MITLDYILGKEKSATDWSENLLLKSGGRELRNNSYMWAYEISLSSGLACGSTETQSSRHPLSLSLSLCFFFPQFCRRDERAISKNAATKLAGLTLARSVGLKQPNIHRARSLSEFVATEFAYVKRTGCLQ